MHSELALYTKFEASRKSKNQSRNMVIRQKDVVGSSSPSTLYSSKHTEQQQKKEFTQVNK